MSFNDAIEAIKKWCRDNFSFRGVAGLLLLVYCAIPDYYSRNEFWKSKMPFLRQFVSEHSRLLLLSIGLLLTWLDHRLVLAKRKNAEKSGLQLSIEGIWWEYNSAKDRTTFVISVYLLNSGRPTVAISWQAEYRLNNATEKMTGSYIIDKFLLRRGDETLTLTNDDLIQTKTLANQIATGDARMGRAMFNLPGNRLEQMRSLQFEVTVTCSDYAGNLATARFTPDPKIPDSIRMYPGEKLTKNAKIDTPAPEPPPQEIKSTP